MSIGKGQKQTFSLTADAFGGFTRDRVQALIAAMPKDRAEAGAAIAATYLSTLEPNGPYPGNEGIVSACDLLARLGTPLAADLLWQAASSARNARIRVEAIRRCGSVAQRAEQRQLLRQWSAEGFGGASFFQNDNISVETVKEAALTSLGDLVAPTPEDIDVIVTGLTPPTNNGREFQPRVFAAAVAAYFKAGEVASFPKIVGLLDGRTWRPEVGLALIALGAKFSATELRPHAEVLRKAMLAHAGTWPADQDQGGRLLTVAERIATPEFMHLWAAQYGIDGFDVGRGRVTRRLIERADNSKVATTRTLLVLASTQNNVTRGGFLIARLREAVASGHATTVADALVAQQSQGHNHLFESGLVGDLFPSVESMTRVFAAALGGRGEPHAQRSVATRIATGMLVTVSRGPTTEQTPALSYDALTNRAGRNQSRYSDELGRIVPTLRGLSDDNNPIVWASRLIHEPAVGPGAAAMIESLVWPDDDLTRYVLNVLVREAVTAPSVATAITQRIEQHLLTPPNQQHVVPRASLQQALVENVVVDGQVNRYAIDLMDRGNLGFELGARRALAGVSSVEDAEFLMGRVAGRGPGAALGVLTEAVRFHRDGDEKLTVTVQALAMARATEAHLADGDPKRLDAFAQQLHQRFQDMAEVRTPAYEACGQLGRFVSIKVLRDRLPRENAAVPKKAILDSLAHLKEKLAGAKPVHGEAEDIKTWLGFVTDLGDVSLLGQVTGYLRPPHADHQVRRAALEAMAAMRGQEALEAVKRFIDDTAPEGETLTVARQARMRLEERNDINLFGILGKYFDAEAEVLDPAIDYDQLLGSELRGSITRSLIKAQTLWEDGHWDEFLTKINGVMEALIKHIFRTRWSVMHIDQAKGEKMAGGSAYAPLLAMTEFKAAFPKLQSHANTIQSFRRESPTAHAMNKDGSAKAEAGQDDADYVRNEFRPAFAEAINALR